MSLGMIVMIMAIAIVTGFQKEIRNKVVGFGSHITITSLTANRSMESTRLLKMQSFYPFLDSVKGIRHIQVFATKPAIIETEKDIQGAVVKGIGSDFDWEFFKDKIVAGKRLELTSNKAESQVIISNSIARTLNISLGQKITLYFPDEKKGLTARIFKVTGIYDTGLEDFDKEWILTDIRHIQQLNHWGIRGTLEIVDSCRLGFIGMKAKGFGGGGGYEYDWSDTLREGSGPHYFEIVTDTTIQVIIGDVTKTIPDTISYFFKVPQTGLAPFCAADLQISKSSSGGTDQLYIGGFEIILDNYEQLLKMDDIIYEDLDFGLKTSTIIDQVPDIFNWLNMLDTNVYVIIALMILVSVINIASALLILILERTNAIGILKAMGSDSFQIRKIFLFQAGYIIIKGLFWGNLIGISLIFLQSKTHYIKLDQDNYFLSYVPVNLHIDHLLILNVGVLVISLSLMILPSWYISKIRPVKAIRFN
jgi:lipoprotein-releasing system permease protein